MLPLYIVFKHWEERHTFSLSPLELPLKIFNHLNILKYTVALFSFIT